ncbi:homoserine O-acetyltransferase [Candidatus Marinamargulisbacteria bacterium SCGC AG-439-L15]|nr:homoserine O-acetyltransferase [Candidatus Marinamargulisbacteria bacterium SCGC AG-439-L15]
MTKQKTYTCFEKTPLVLESGKTLASITLAYHSYGKLNSDKSNVILVCHALTGDANALEWWNSFIGPNKAIDTSRYFVICINAIGGCKGSTGPASINPKTKKAYGKTFPVITIGDIVKSHKALIDHLGIQTIQMVIGGSMGGMMALEWAVHYPDLVKSCVPIAATARVSPLAIAFDAVGRDAVSVAGPDKGLAVARKLGHITYLSEQSMDQKFGRNLQDKDSYGYDFGVDFQIESYLNHQGEKFVTHFDANSYLYLTKAVSYFDLAQKYGSLERAFAAITAKFLVISITSDWLYTPKQSKEIVRSLMKLNKDVTYVEVDSYYGHDAFLIENDALFDIIKVFLETQT